MYSDYEYPMRIALWCLLITAAWHLFVGVSGLLFAPRGAYTPALLVLFIASGALGFVLLGQILFRLRPMRQLYTATALLMVAFLVAYADVHVYGTLEQTLPIDLTYRGLHDHHTHGRGLVWHSVSSDPAALISKAVEAVAGVIFAVYAILDR